MAGLFDNFNKTMGVDDKRIDAQQTETIVRYGNFFRDLSGSASRPDAALTMKDGRHEVSDNILNQYSIANEVVSDEIRQSIDELDQLAVTSQSIAGMDNRTRIALIARGNHGADPARIKQKESEIIRRLDDLTRDVVNEGKRNTRILQEQSIQTNSLNLKAAERSEEAAAEIARYKEITKDMTVEELTTAFNGEGLEGVPRVALSQVLLNRQALRLDIANNNALLNPENNGVIGGFPRGNVSRTTGSSTGKGKPITNEQLVKDQVNFLATRVHGGVLEAALQDNIEEELMVVKEGGQPPLNTTIELPEIGTVNISVAKEALTKITERDNKLGKAQSETFNNQAQLATKTWNATFAAFNDKMNQLFIDPSDPQTPIGREMINLNREFEAAALAGDAGTMAEVTKKLQTRSDQIVDDMVDSDAIPEEQRPFLLGLVTTGGPLSAIDGARYLNDVAGIDLEIATRDSLVFSSVGDYFNNVKAQAQRDFLNSEETANNALITGKQPEFTDEMGIEAIEKNFDSNFAAKLMINDTADAMLSNTVYDIIEESLNVAREAGDPPALRRLEQARTLIFGENHVAREIVGDGENFSLRSMQAVSATGNDGEIITLQREDGSPVTQDVLNKKITFTMLNGVSAKLKEAGIDIDLTTEAVTRLTENRNLMLSNMMPRLPQEKALLAAVSSTYLLNKGSGELPAMNRIYSIALNGIKKSMVNVEDFDESKEVFQNLTGGQRIRNLQDRTAAIQLEIIERSKNDNSVITRTMENTLFEATNLAVKEQNAILNGDDVDGGLAEQNIGSIVDSFFN